MMCNYLVFNFSVLDMSSSLGLFNRIPTPGTRIYPDRVNTSQAHLCTNWLQGISYFHPKTSWQPIPSNRLFQSCSQCLDIALALEKRRRTGEREKQRTWRPFTLNATLSYLRLIRPGSQTGHGIDFLFCNMYFFIFCLFVRVLSWYLNYSFLCARILLIYLGFQSIEGQRRWTI